MTPIIETFLLAATNTDLLSAGRLNSIPFGGLLTLQFLADLSDVTNFYTLTLQLPGGDVPIDAQRVPSSGNGLDGNLNDEDLFEVAYFAPQGAHFVVSLTESGTATCMVLAQLR